MDSRLHTVLFVFLLLLPFRGAAKQAAYEDWFSLPSEQLLEQAWSYSHGGNIADSTVVCLTLVVNRYEAKLPDHEKQWCVRACLDLWRIYFYHYYDYSKCFEYLTKARRMADSYKAVVPEIEMDFGCMYQTIAEQSHDAHLAQEALKSYSLAFNQAFTSVERYAKLLDDIFANLVFVAYSLNDLSQIESMWISYKQLPTADSTYYRSYNHLMYKGLAHLLANEYQEAIVCFERQAQSLPRSKAHVRHHYVSITNKARVYMAQGNYAAASEELKQAESIALRTEMKDMQLDVYELLANCYNHMGLVDEKERYRDLYFSQKDALINYRQLAGISEARFYGQLEQLNNEMDKMRERRSRQNIALLISGLVLTIVLASLLMLQRNYRKLKEANSVLYRKNVELLKLEEEEKRHRRQQGNDTEIEKYKNSNLNETTKTELYQRIQEVMDNTEHVCMPDFSVETLALQVGSKYKYVSQVIHEKYGANFNTFLNEYRIKEACKRMADEAHYGHLTIEGIARSVGFRSRSAFAQSFKRITGLMPSEYQKLAKGR